MNRKGQQMDFEELIKFILAAVILLPLLGAMLSLIGSISLQSCPTCDCSSFQNSLNQCVQQVNNLTIQLNQTPVIIRENITYVEVPVEKIIYKEKITPLTINILSLIFSITITISLFKIRLPKELEEKLMKIEKAIKFAKIGSLVVSFLIFLKLVIVLFFM